MIHTIRARNVQDAYVRGIAHIRKVGEREETRNGPVRVAPGPVVTVYEQPLERVLTDPVRDANPFFHLLESIWMLCGRNDVSSLAPILGSIKKFSDNGVTFHGAYGFRWRRHFNTTEDIKDEAGETFGLHTGPFDQLCEIIKLLRANPQDRRLVVGMWDPEEDLGKEGADFPCNTQLIFRSRIDPLGDESNYTDRVLDMTIVNRSNDIIWGAYGANAVHMSVVLEFVAACSGMKIGRMYQFSNNWHAYDDTLLKAGKPKVLDGVRYQWFGDMVPTELFDRDVCRAMDPAVILSELELWWERRFAGTCVAGMTERGFLTIESMRRVHGVWKRGALEMARQQARSIPGQDWRVACTEWLNRRKK